MYCLFRVSYGCRIAVKSARNRFKISIFSSVASTISDFAWNTFWPRTSVSTPITSPIRHPGGAEYLHAIDSRHEQSYAVVADYGDTLRVTLEGLQFESCKVNALELLGGVHLHLVLAEVVVAKAFKPLAQLVA